MGHLPDVVNGYKWELYNIAEDYSENNDLAAKMTDKLRNMQELFLVEAAKYNVFPLDNSILQRALTPRPSPTAGKSVFTYSGEVSGIPEGSAPSTLGKSFSITAEVDIPQGGAEGMLNTIGGRFGGYGLYLVKGKPVFTYVQLTTERFRWESHQSCCSPWRTRRLCAAGTDSGNFLRAADARCAGRHDDNRREVSPAATAKVRRHDQPGGQRFQTVLAAEGGAAQGCAQHLADHDR
jgi:hypothetical protein